MKLAIVRKRFASAGGAEQFIVDTTNALAELGVEATLISEGLDGAGNLGDRLIKLPASKGSRSRRYRALQKAVEDALGQRSFTLVQSHERIVNADIFRAGDGVHAAWVDRLKRSRRWWRRVAMNYDPLHRLLMETERRMARETDMVFVANSMVVAGELRDWLDVPQERLRVIENRISSTHTPASITGYRHWRESAWRDLPRLCAPGTSARPFRAIFPRGGFTTRVVSLS